MSSELSRLPTEQPNPATRELDRVGVREAVALVQAEDRAIHAALEAAREPIARAVELVAARLEHGGRLFYLGAGTSGRLAMLDAVECPPTFQTPPGWVQAVIAGGPEALTRAVEGAEDDREAAGRELDRRGLCARDVVLGIAASGRTPFVLAGLEHARARGAATIFLACVPRELAQDPADVSIRVVTGPEVLAGSTRMKAGTATKLVLNTISTLAMVRLGRTYGNRMVALDTRGNAKLAERGARLVAELGPCDRDHAERRLAEADGQVRVAILLARRGGTAAEARALIERCGGSLRAALGESERPGSDTSKNPPAPDA